MALILDTPVSTPALKITTGAAANRLLYSDASGNGSWAGLPQVRTIATRASVATVANTLTSVLNVSIPANSLKVGDEFRVSAFIGRSGTNAATNTNSLRFGTTTLTGAVLIEIGTRPNSTTAFVVCDIIVRAIGATGTFWISRAVTTGPTGSNVTGWATATVDTTVTNLLELTTISGQSTNSVIWNNTTIEKLES